MAVYGTGIDIIEISRIERAMGRKGFAKRVFGTSELDYFSVNNSKPQTIAANFCAKEAFAKALGTGVRGIRLTEIEVLRRENGQPCFKLSGAAKTFAKELGLTFHLSLSHERKYACAFVLAEREGRRDE